MSESSASGAGAFLERDDALLALEGFLTEVVEGGGGKLLLVTGEAGVGKTALLRRFSSSQEASIRVLSGSCEPLDVFRLLARRVQSERAFTVASLRDDELDRATQRSGAGRPPPHPPTDRRRCRIRIVFAPTGSIRTRRPIV
jgi:hypothetical protein